MYVKSVLSLATADTPAAGVGELAIAHVTEDRAKPEFRRHAWLLVTYLIDFYLVFVPWQAITRDLHTLASALIDYALEMEAAHGDATAKPA